MKSEDISLDRDSRLVFLKRRVCFYEREWTLKYQTQCTDDSDWKNSTIRVSHKKYTIRRRFKRWLKRRNPKHSPIHFKEDRYITEVSEDASVKTHVLTVSATHEADQPLYYSLSTPEDLRSANLFSLDTVSGEIRVAKSLDRETLGRHVLKVTAYERLDPSVASSATVIVDVLDAQDNAPKFEQSSYYAEIREDAPIGTTVQSVFARDMDAGKNGEVEYSLADSVGRNLFAINAKSGVIQTNAELDREETPFIRLNVVAADRGVPSLNSSALVEITVSDVNDNAPKFLLDAYSVTVAENVTIPSVILTVTANDADVGSNGKVHYSIASTSSSGLFSMDYDSGELSLIKRPDPRDSPLSLMLRAKDSGQPALSSTVHCTVTVVDVNDHAPRFLAVSGHEFFVEENIPVGTEVGRIFAVDEDSGSNGEIRYSLLGESELFEIDAVNGAIRTKADVDREYNERYSLKVKVEDGGRPALHSVTSVEVFIKDVNDNSPSFGQLHYLLTAPENTPRGSELLRLHATDVDVAQKLSYRIEYMTRDVFALIPMGTNEGALLTLAKDLSSDDEELLVVVSATDQGGLQGRCNVSIRIDDINTPPVFSGNPFSVRVSEDAAVGTQVIGMKAEDKDRGSNAELVFAIDSEDFR
ncbi:Cadherin domain containing protein [Aphelenchoides avenae]|nr:Cadherin domain containing protein [Aphelenchus avenae]